MRFFASMPFWRTNPSRGMLTEVAETATAKAMETIAENFTMRPAVKERGGLRK